MELLVATAIASAVTLSSFLLYGQYCKNVYRLQANCQRDSKELILEMYRAMPYDARGVRKAVQ